MGLGGGEMGDACSRLSSQYESEYGIFLLHCRGYTTLMRHRHQTVLLTKSPVSKYSAVTSVQSAVSEP